jgi:squalene-hopene/tetraprenyl-beta-curcumene cyclase
MGNLGLVVVMLSLSTAAEPATAETPPTSEQARSAVERGLAHVDKAGQAWLKERKCIGCHHGAFMLWTFNEAKQRGFAIDAKKLDEMNNQVLTMFVTDKAEMEKNKSGQVRGAQVILAQAGAAPSDPKLTDMLKEARAYILKRQQDDGSWKYAGQTQERPAQEANETTTMWAFLALSASSDGDEAAARERAKVWLEKNRTGTGNEALVLRLLLEQKFGAPEKAKGLLEELIARQNTDGGWSWSTTRKSDPFATGQSLYALGSLGRGSDDPAVQKAWKFLLAAQKPDGSWFAPTKKDNGGSAIASYWGSTWAVMGLVKTLPATVQ